MRKPDISTLSLFEPPPSKPVAPIETITPQVRRNTPWTKRNAVAVKAPPHAPHVMLVIDNGALGDAQFHIQALCQALRSRVTFTLVIGGVVTQSALSQELTALGVQVCSLPEMGESLNPLKLWRCVTQLRSLIQAHKPDLLHAQSATAAVATRLVGQRCKLPVVYTVHGFSFHPEAPWLQRMVTMLTERLLAKRTAHMICTSAYERTLANKLPIPSERVHVIAHGVEKLISTQVTQMATPTQAQQDNANTPRLIMVGRTQHPKCHDLLLHALAKVQQTLGSEMSTTFVGDGALTQQLQAKAQALNLQHITWLDDVFDVRTLLPQHDILISLSEHDGMPLMVLEAMRAGLCVIASDQPCVREHITPEVNGVLVANTPELIAQQLLRFVHYPLFRQRLARTAQETMQHHWGVEEMADAVQQVYQQCVQESTTLASTPPQPIQHIQPNSNANLASVSVQHQDALQSWVLWGAWMVVPFFVAVQLLQVAGFEATQFGQTLAWCALPSIAASLLLMRTAKLPVTARHMAFWSCASAPFLLTPLVFSLLQQPYSLTAVALTYVAATLWLRLGYRRYVKHRALRLVFFDANLPTALSAHLLSETMDAQSVQLQYWFASKQLPLPACDGVVLDPHAHTTPERERLLSEVKMRHLRLYSVEAIVELTSGRKLLPNEPSALLEIDNDPSYDRIKRLIDVFIILALAPLWLPITVCVALAVRFYTKGPAYASQPHVGRNGHVFMLWQFRRLLNSPRLDEDPSAHVEALRMSQIEELLHRTRLDHLPQLLNVLMGHMSLVGPRPEPTACAREFAATIPGYPYRHLVRPGLCGWAQVQQDDAHNINDVRRRLSYDLYYVANYSLALDLLIAAQTVKAILTTWVKR